MSQSVSVHSLDKIVGTASSYSVQLRNKIPAGRYKATVRGLIGVGNDAFIVRLCWGNIVCCGNKQLDAYESVATGYSAVPFVGEFLVQDPGQSMDVQILSATTGAAPAATSEHAFTIYLQLLQE